MTANTSFFTDLPALPPYELHPVPPLLPPFQDKHLTLVLPILAYWILSMFFHFIDIKDLFSQYRLHTPAEILKRNHVSRWEVARDVIIQQIVQTVVGVALVWTEPPQMAGKDDYNVALWAQRLRIAQRSLPAILSCFAIDSGELVRHVSRSYPTLAGALEGGRYPWLLSQHDGGPLTLFAPWEILAGKVTYWFIIPALQFGVAIVIVDTWQYFLHRAMHMNKWLYTTFHSRHHRLYVPYAYGALYNHPFEGFLLDTLGTGVGYLVAGLTPRQSMWFFTGSTIKTVDDHCGYALPWDPLQHLTSNNAGYHDVHHQSWGIKTNFSQPFFTFWDRLLGTVWTGGDMSARYERARLAAQRKIDGEAQSYGQDTAAHITASNPVDSILETSNKPYSLESSVPSVKRCNESSQPQPPLGKAATQAATQALNSRDQILQTRPAAGGGPAILAEESVEEQKERLAARIRRSPRRPVTSSTSSQAGSLKGLRDRVSGSGSFHGRKGSLLGYETSH